MGEGGWLEHWPWRPVERALRWLPAPLFGRFVADCRCLVRAAGGQDDRKRPRLSLPAVPSWTEVPNVLTLTPAGPRTGLLAYWTQGPEKKGPSHSGN